MNVQADLTFSVGRGWPQLTSPLSGTQVAFPQFQLARHLKLPTPMVAYRHFNGEIDDCDCPHKFTHLVTPTRV